MKLYVCREQKVEEARFCDEFVHTCHTSGARIQKTTKLKINKAGNGGVT
jgi:hypothetical protein